MAYSRRLALIVGLGAVVFPASASAADTWTDPHPGVEHLDRVNSDPNRIHVLRIDLRRPELRVRATRSEDRGMTTSGFAEKYGCAMAINGDFWQWDGFTTSGLSVGHGEVWPGEKDTAGEGFIAVGVDNSTFIQTPMELLETPEPWMEDVVGGRPLIVADGVALETANCDPHFCALHPRTAVGLSEDGKTLLLATVDGRRSTSIGMTTKQVGNLMVEMGAWRALNLDGGGSTAMYLKAEGGVVNIPSGPPTQGVERVVANHLGVEIVPPFGKLVGTVLDGSEALAGATVALPSGDTTTTDDAGAFIFEQADAGNSTVTAEIDGYEPGSVELWVAADATTSVSLVLLAKKPDDPPPPLQEDPTTADPAAPPSTEAGCSVGASRPKGDTPAWLALVALTVLTVITGRRRSRRGA